MTAPSIDDLAGDPHPHLARLRARSPVAQVDALGGWLVTSRAAAMAVLQDPATFTVDDARFSTAQVVGPSMLSTEGEVHARHRRPFVGPFGRRRVHTDLAAAVRDEVSRRFDVVELVRPVDLRAAVAGPVAAATMAIALGFDVADEGVVDRLLGWYRDIVDSVAGVAEGRGVTAAGEAAMASLREALAPVMSGGGRTSVLHDARDVLDEDEVVSNAAVALFGGIETTEGMILNLLWHVLGDASTRDAVAADPQLVAAAVSESLRLEPAAAVVDRYATRDVELDGASIAGGDLVVVSLAGANRDPAEFPDPDRFDLRRANVARQLAFAAGPHTCLGIELARLEAATVLSTLLSRWPCARLAEGAPAPTGLVFRKPSRLPVSCPSL